MIFDVQAEKMIHAHLTVSVSYLKQLLLFSRLVTLISLLFSVQLIGHYIVQQRTNYLICQILITTDTILSVRDSEMQVVLQKLTSVCGPNSLKRFQVTDLPDKLTSTILNKSNLIMLSSDNTKRIFSISIENKTNATQKFLYTSQQFY